MMYFMTKKSFFLGGLLSFINEFFSLSGVILLDRITDNLKVGIVTTEDKIFTTLYLVGMVVCYVGKSFALSQWDWNHTIWVYFNFF